MDEIDFTTFPCGHAPNAYVGFGICSRCHMKSCSRCLMRLGGLLLCGACFEKYLRGEEHD
jgi:hypothetical protein